MKIDFTTELVNKLRDYCRVSASSLNNDVLSRNYQYYAEEALSDLLLRWHKKNLKGDWKEKQLNDNFYFISCKNTVRNIIIREDRNKVQVMKDYGNISIDKDAEEEEIIIQLESDYEKSIEAVQMREDKMNGMIESIVESLENSPYMQPEDVTVFVETFLNRKQIPIVAKELNLSRQRIADSRARIRNIINRDYNNRLFL
jgi:hypothetical protein